MNKNSKGGRSNRRNAVLHASGVSHALWPSQMRRSPATAKIAQRRRLMLLKGTWWFRKPRQLQNKQQVKKLVEFQSALPIYLLYTTLAISLLVVGVLLAMFVLHPWPITLLLVLVWTATIMLTIRLWYTCLYMTLAARRVRRETKHQPIQPLPPIAKTHPLHPASTIPVTRPLPPSRPGFLATPIPSTPLIRILETIDLSSTNIEHFLDSVQPSNQQIPHTQIDSGFTSDSIPDLTLDSTPESPMKTQQSEHADMPADNEASKAP
jgi:hypothetical protein